MHRNLKSSETGRIEYASLFEPARVEPEHHPGNYSCRGGARRDFSWHGWRASAEFACAIWLARVEADTGFSIPVTLSNWSRADSPRAISRWDLFSFFFLPCVEIAEMWQASISRTRLKL